METQKARNEYRRIRSLVCAALECTTADFDRRAADIGTQDGEGEPATAADFMRGALELAHDAGVTV